MGAPGPRCFDSFTIEGQRYEWIGDYAHTRQDGRISVMASWQTQCKTCAAQFILHHPQRPAPHYPVRNCPSCVRSKQAAKAQAALNTQTPSQEIQPPPNPMARQTKAHRTAPTDQTSRATEQEQSPPINTIQNNNTLNTNSTQTTRNNENATHNNANATASGQGGPRAAISSHRTPINTASQTPPVQPPNPVATPRRVFTDR